MEKVVINNRFKFEKLNNLRWRGFDSLLNTILLIKTINDIPKLILKNKLIPKVPYKKKIHEIYLQI